MSPSGNYDKCKDIIDTYSKVFNDVDNKRDIIETTPYDPVFLHLYATWGANELNNDTSLFDEMQRNQGTRFSTFYNKYYVHYKDLEPKHSIKNYYSLCKKILPEHMTIGDGWVDIKASGAEVGAIMGTLDSLGQWYVDNVYTYLAGNYGANRDDDNNLIYYNDTSNKTFYGFPTDDTIYYNQFIARFNAKYANANGTDVLDADGNIIKKSVKTKRKENIELKSNGNFSEDYLEHSTINGINVINGSNIDENWLAFELCERSARGADIVSNTGEILKKGMDERGKYTCELVGGNKVGDDCSGFASAVIYKFIKDNKIGNYQNYKYQTWGSGKFLEEMAPTDTSDLKNSKIAYTLEKYGFKQYTAAEIMRIEDFKLQPGDLLCRKGHVEFYKGLPNSNSFGWGNVHNSYDENTGYTFILNADGTFTVDGSGEPYKVIYRYVGLK